MIICITSKYIPNTLDPLHSYKTANQAAGEHSLIKNISSKPLGSGPVSSLSSEACSVHSDRKVQINKLPVFKFYAAACTGSHTLLALLCCFSALDQWESSLPPHGTTAHSSQADPWRFFPSSHSLLSTYLLFFLSLVCVNAGYIFPKFSAHPLLLLHSREGRAPSGLGLP